jgi:hypothetical protein
VSTTLTRYWDAFVSPRGQYVLLVALLLIAGVSFALAGLGSGAGFGTFVGVIGLVIVAIDLVVVVRTTLRRWRRRNSPEPPAPLHWQPGPGQ